MFVVFSVYRVVFWGGCNYGHVGGLFTFFTLDINGVGYNVYQGDYATLVPWGSLWVEYNFGSFYGFNTFFDAPTGATIRVFQGPRGGRFNVGLVDFIAGLYGGLFNIVFHGGAF